MPERGELHERVSGVLHVVYLIFNEGYSATGGPHLTRADLCAEAIRLAREVNALIEDAEGLGLLALMLLHEARREARTMDRLHVLRHQMGGHAIGYGLREELRGTGVRVTLIEPGTVDTPFFDAPKPEGLTPEDIARAVLYALEQPPSVDVHELTVLPTPPLA